MSSSWVPRSIMRPCSMTMMQSALRTVESRWAMTKVVRPAHQGVHAVLHQLLGAGVDGGGGLVQDEHRRVGHGRPGNGQQLPLALGEVGAVAGEHGVVAVGQAADEAVGVGQLGGGDALLVAWRPGCRSGCSPSPCR